MHHHCPSDQSDPAREQNQHYYCVKKARGLEIYLQIHQNASCDDDNADRDQDPANYRPTVEENERNPKDQRDERQPECVVTAPIPESAGDDNAADEHVAASDRHDETDKELDHAARGSAWFFQIVELHISGYFNVGAVP